MEPKASDITALVELFASSEWDELHIEIDGLQLFLSTDPNARLASGPAPAATAVSAASAPMVAAPVAPAAVAATPASGGGPVPSHWVAVTAPNLGTFYRSPKPGAAPYVTVGQTVTADSEVCLLEVMKLFTTVRAGTAGIVRRICVEDAVMVDYGAVLFYIEPG